MARGKGQGRRAMTLDGATVETTRYSGVYAHDVRYGDTVVATYRSADGSGQETLLEMPRDRVERLVRAGLDRIVANAEAGMEVALTVAGAAADQLEFADGLCKRAKDCPDAAVRAAHDRAWSEAMAEMGTGNRNLESSLDHAVRSHWVRDRFEDGVRQCLTWRNARAAKVEDSAEPAANRRLAGKLERRGFRSEWTMATNLPREWLEEAERGPACVERYMTAGGWLPSVERVVLVDSALEAAAHQAQAGEGAFVNALYVLVPKPSCGADLAKFLKMACVTIQDARKAAGHKVGPVEVAVDIVRRDLSIFGFADKAANQGMTFVDGRSPTGLSWAQALVRREADLVRRHVERDRWQGMSL